MQLRNITLGKHLCQQMLLTTWIITFSAIINDFLFWLLRCDCSYSVAWLAEVMKSTSTGRESVTCQRSLALLFHFYKVVEQHFFIRNKPFSSWHDFRRKNWARHCQERHLLQQTLASSWHEIISKNRTQATKFAQTCHCTVLCFLCLDLRFSLGVVFILFFFPHISMGLHNFNAFSKAECVENA